MEIWVSTHLQKCTRAHVSPCPLVKAHAVIIVHRTGCRAEVPHPVVEGQISRSLLPWPHLNSLTPVAPPLASMQQTHALVRKPKPYIDPAYCR